MKGVSIPKLTKSDEEIRRCFELNLQRRGGITLEQMCLALGLYRVRSKGDVPQFRKAEVNRVDAICTAALASPECRREEGRTIRYLLKPPTQAFVPARGPEVKVTRDPKLATWTPERAAEQLAERRRQKAAMYGERSAPQKSAAELRRHVVAVTGSALTPSPSPKTGRGGQETSPQESPSQGEGGGAGAGETPAAQEISQKEEDTVNADQAARAKAADEKLDRVLAELEADWPRTRCNLSQICRSGGFSSSFFAVTKPRGEERKARALAAIARRKAALAADTSSQSEAPSPSPSPETGRRGSEADAVAVGKWATQIEALAEENRRLRDRLAALEQQARPEPEAAADPREVLESRLPALEQRIETLNDQIKDLERQREECWGRIKSIEGCLEIL